MPRASKKATSDDVESDATPDAIVDVLRSHRYLYNDEVELQDGLEGVLVASGFRVRREVRLNARDRIDLLVGRVGVEVKIAGSVESLTRQLTRYAHCDEIDDLVVIVDRAKLTAVPKSVAGVATYVVFISGFA